MIFMLVCLPMHPSAFQSERITIPQTPQESWQRKLEGTRQMHEGLHNAVRESAKKTTQDRREEPQILTITKKPIHPRPR